MKIKPSLLKITLLYLIGLLILSAIIFVCFINLFLFTAWGPTQYIVISGFSLIFIFCYLVAITRFYYIVENDYVAVVKFSKEYRYLYNEILYVSDEKDDKKLTVSFYHQKHGYVYLLKDRNNVIGKELLKKCPDAEKDLATFKHKFPNVK